VLLKRCNKNTAFLDFQYSTLIMLIARWPDKR
jgi:hypothetical protein